MSVSGLFLEQFGVTFDLLWQTGCIEFHVLHVLSIIIINFKVILVNLYLHLASLSLLFW